MHQLSRHELSRMTALLRENLANLKESRACSKSKNGCINCKNHYAHCPYDRLHGGIENIERTLREVDIDHEFYPTTLQVALQILKDVQKQIRKMAPDAQEDQVFSIPGRSMIRD